jgi:hypothetical protein
LGIVTIRTPFLKAASISLVLRLLALDRQDSIGDLHLDVLLVEPRQLGGQHERLLILGQADGGRRYG